VTLDTSGDTPFAAIRAPGTYLLLLSLAQPQRLAIGSLGVVDLPAGWYVYVGSALGGLGPRLRRHARLEKRLHWHIDTLRAASTLVAIAWHVGADRLECTVARDVAAWPDATLPVQRFGSSDCRCRSHLVHFPACPDLTPGPGWEVWSLPGADQGLGPGSAGGDGAASAGTGW
jgi:Uri superfamily endonuclease